MTAGATGITAVWCCGSVIAVAKRLSLFSRPETAGWIIWQVPSSKDLMTNAELSVL